MNSSGGQRDRVAGVDDGLDQPDRHTPGRQRRKPRQTPPWPVRWARQARLWHRWTGILLSLVMSVLAISGAFVAYKKQLEYLQPANRSGTPMPIREMLAPADIADIVARHLRGAEQAALPTINRIELRPDKSLYKVRLEAAGPLSSPIELQIDAGTGEVLNEGVRGDQLWMDIHSFAVFGPGTKLLVMTLSGVSLLWLALSGVYLFVFPPWFRSAKRRSR